MYMKKDAITWKLFQSSTTVLLNISCVLEEVWFANVSFRNSC